MARLRYRKGWIVVGAGREVRLTRSEVTILFGLMLRPLSRPEDIANDLWPAQWPDSWWSGLTALICLMRRKVRVVGLNIVARNGRGYSLVTG